MPRVSPAPWRRSASRRREWRRHSPQPLRELHESGVRRRDRQDRPVHALRRLLDDPSTFHPTFAILAEGSASWAIIPGGLQGFRPDAGVVTAATGLGSEALVVRTRANGKDAQMAQLPTAQRMGQIDGISAGSVFLVDRRLLGQFRQYLLGEFHDLRHSLQEDIGAGKDMDLVTGPRERRDVD
jgi:hypothetical protein